MARSRMVKTLCALLAGMLLFAGCDALKGGSDETVNVDSVAVLAGVNGFAGTQNRFAGMVEPQKTMYVDPEQGRSIKLVLVEEGQSVKAGDALFVYDTEELELQLEQAKLDIDRIDNRITSLYNEINTLENEKEKASEANKIEYTVEIQNRYSTIKEEEYNKKVRQAEIERLNEKIADDRVKAEMSGRIQSFDPTALEGYQDYYSGKQKHYITIMAEGDFRIKAQINEQNVREIHEGDAVLVRSRVKEDETWSGVIQEIDLTQSTPEEGGGYYIGGSDKSNGTTKYPFYVVLDDYEGLLLGQHVLVELESDHAGSDKLMLPAAYIVMPQTGNAYAWIERNGKLAKQTLILGDYDASADTFEVVSGVGAADYIAFPRDGLKEGMNTAHSMAEDEDPGPRGGLTR